MEIRVGSDKATVRMIGNLDRGTVPALRKPLLRVALRGGIHAVEVDLSAVSAMDTAGVAVLVEMLRTVQKGGAQFCLCGVSESLRRVIQLTRLDEAFGINNLN